MAASRLGWDAQAVAFPKGISRCRGNDAFSYCSVPCHTQCLSILPSALPYCPLGNTQCLSALPSAETREREHVLAPISGKGCLASGAAGRFLAQDKNSMQRFALHCKPELSISHCIDQRWWNREEKATTMHSARPCYTMLACAMLYLLCHAMHRARSI